MRKLWRILCDTCHKVIYDADLDIEPADTITEKEPDRTYHFCNMGCHVDYKETSDE